MAILVGPGGLGTPAEKGIDKYKKAGLGCAEVEFTHSIYMDNKRAKEVGDYAKKQGILLSIHAPYYLNLVSKKKSVIIASMKTILKCAELGYHMGAKYIVFHSGYYSGRDKDEAFEMVERAIKEMNSVINKNNWNVMLAPETTGKLSQFGDIDELYAMQKKTKCAVCVDFAHMRAKYNGKIDFRHICDTMKKFSFRPLHLHMSGITWGPKGEKAHKLTPIDEIKEVLHWLKKYNFSVTMINESPDTFGDAVKTVKLLH